MRLLERNNDGEFSLTEDLIDNVPPYAILSHTWGEDHQEVNFKDLTIGSRRTISGYQKLRFCAEQAARDGLQHFWVDTCCIDKSNSVELQEAITSMFGWYHNAAKCYVYLSDVSIIKQKASEQSSEFTWDVAFRASKWFTRGWTLQELLAPASVEFFSGEGKRLGDKRTLEREIHDITGIAVQALRGIPLSQFSIEERMSWAETRQTRRKEDKAYSLLGIFSVHMPLLYGEGVESALSRLQEEIQRKIRPNHHHPASLLGRLSYAVEAPFNSYTKQHEPTCLPNTRVDLLRTIYSWADTHDESTVFWLNGLAGTGKSTIARTVARHYFDKQLLGASFFFSRGGGDVSHAGKFVMSIAMQLTTSIPALRQYFSDAITERSDIASRSLRDQWHELVLLPLSKLNSNDCQSSYVLVVDALDECDDEDNIRLILHLLAEVRSLERVRLRIFLTSRPETPVRHGFCQIQDEEHKDVVLHNISPSIIDHDIAIFLEYTLNLIGQERSLDTGWLDKEVIKCLVQAASGLFIWAATACRFIKEGLFAEERVCLILEAGTSRTTPEEQLDKIYTTVLDRSIHSTYAGPETEIFYSMLRLVLGSIVSLSSSLSLMSLGRLLGVRKQMMDQLLKDLHAILDIPKAEMSLLRLHHPSFRDFLLSKDRCKDLNFLVDEKQAHRALAESCIQFMSTILKQDICGLDAPGALVANIDSGQVEHCIPPELQYACLYWIQHLQKSRTLLRDDDQVHKFLQEHLLHWLEALGWMGKVSEGIHAIVLLESFASSCDCPQLSDFIHDTGRFVLYNRSAIEQAPLQTYYSALLFVPTMSIVRKQFQDCIPRWVRRLPKVDSDWNALLQTLEGHSTSIIAVAFSPDGKTLASVSLEETVKLWDCRSGAVLQTFENRKGSARAIAFSLDSKTLALASYDGIVKLLDTCLGTVLQTLKIDLLHAHAIAFSLGNKILASASYSTVKLWDTRSGVLLQTLGSYSAFAQAISFSLDSKMLALASSDGLVKLWDTCLGVVLQTLKAHLDPRAIAFSPDSKILATASFYGIVELWDPRLGVVLKTLSAYSTCVFALAFSSDCKVVASASFNRTINRWDVCSGMALQTLKGHSDSIQAIAFSADGRILASGSDDATIKLWNNYSDTVLQPLEDNLQCVRAIAFSPDGKTLASASDNKTIKLWDSRSGTILQTLKGSGSTCAVAFSPDSKILATASRNGTVKLWNVRSGTILQRLKDYSEPIQAIAFSADGKTLASGSRYGTVKLWDTYLGVVLHTLKACTNSPAIAFSPDSKILATASRNGTVKLWNARSGTVLQTLKVDSDVKSLSFSNDGTFFQTDRGQLYSTFLPSNAALSRLSISPSLFIDEHWVSWNKERMLYLSYEHQPNCVAIYNGMVALGYRTGRVQFIEFAF